MLTLVVGYALQRELTRQSTGAIVQPVAAAAPVRALSPEEEAYAAALWPIHRDAKLAALAMAFAGIAYKTDGEDSARLEVEVTPLVQGFRAATDRARALDVPASVREVHERYLGVLAAYEEAAQVTVEVARHGGEERLIEAQETSFRASEDALRVGDVLWPGEYKPH